MTAGNLVKCTMCGTIYEENTTCPNGCKYIDEDGLLTHYDCISIKC